MNFVLMCGGGPILKHLLLSVAILFDLFVNVQHENVARYPLSDLMMNYVSNHRAARLVLLYVPDFFCIVW